MKTKGRRAFLASAAVGTVGLIGVLLAGCNTVEGAGKDIENAGGAIKRKARKEKRD